MPNEYKSVCNTIFKATEVENPHSDEKDLVIINWTVKSWSHLSLIPTAPENLEILDASKLYHFKGKIIVIVFIA